MDEGGRMERNLTSPLVSECCEYKVGARSYRCRVCAIKIQLSSKALGSYGVKYFASSDRWKPIY